MKMSDNLYMSQSTDTVAKINNRLVAYIRVDQAKEERERAEGP
jgi:hypothetical protein